jgi:hypothetical protein
MTRDPTITKGTPVVHTLTTDELARLLGESSAGHYASEAAARLLGGHRCLLDRGDFLAACIDYDHDGTQPVAWIVWSAICEFVDRPQLSGSEARILRLVAELGGIDTGVPLADLLSGFDDRNARLVLDALTHALSHGGRR